MLQVLRQALARRLEPRLAARLRFARAAHRFERGAGLTVGVRERGFAGASASAAAWRAASASCVCDISARRCARKLSGASASFACSPSASARRASSSPICARARSAAHSRSRHRARSLRAASDALCASRRAHRARRALRSPPRALRPLRRARRSRSAASACEMSVPDSAASASSRRRRNSSRSTASAALRLFERGKPRGDLRAAAFGGGMALADFFECDARGAIGLARGLVFSREALDLGARGLRARPRLRRPGARLRALAQQILQAVLLGEAAHRRRRRFRRVAEAVPAPEVALARDQALAGSEQRMQLLAFAAQNDADLREPSRQCRRRLHVLGERVRRPAAGGSPCASMSAQCAGADWSVEASRSSPSTAPIAAS